MEQTQKTPAEIFAAKALASQVRKELTDNILPYWATKMVLPSGGFLGRISGTEEADEDAPVGGIMTARLLWTFASAYRVLYSEAGARKASEEAAQGYLDVAMRAKRLIIDRFYDTEYGGTYWSLRPDGTPLDTKKQIYAIGFAIYGLAELYRACGDEEALEYAVKLFHSIEAHSFDTEKDGYFEAFNRDWSPIADMRLSDKDANESKTMNTHLHVLEAYTCLLRVWKDKLLEERLEGLINIFTDRILGPDGHLRLFFDDDWRCNYDIVSYGHDIEASWLLHEASLVLGKPEVTARVEALVPAVAKAASEGFTAEGGMIYESVGHTAPDGTRSVETDADRHWWVQAETVVGNFNLWHHFGSQEGLENALMCWELIKTHIIDKTNGEWFWSLRADGTVNRQDDKAGFWKCPYHNGRMCLEILERLSPRP